MRDLIVTENITLDGVIDASEGWFAVADDPEGDQSDLQEALGEQSAAADAVLFGRVNEYRLFVYPVVVGRGRRLFPDGTSVPALRLVETRPFRSGVVLLRYRPAGG